MAPDLMLVDIFSYSCFNCQRSLQYMSKLERKYQKYGLEFVLVHPPEWDFERNYKNIDQALSKISLPIIIDKDKKLIKKYKIDFWPTQLLISKGKVVYKHIGEGNYSVLESEIQKKLGVTTKKVFVKEPKYTRYTTIYLGKKKTNIKLILQGRWVQKSEYLQHRGKKGSLCIKAKGHAVYAVAEAPEETCVEVEAEGKIRKIIIHEPRLYLMTSLKRGSVVKITVYSKINIYSFAFE
ncbi:MAG TPA: thioredoxin-like domain-containing protein [Candidatus Nanoarchaeia archaeon]|nr:thioredoxin-like domain-containing protein [Candidatus Nanoarchaeia archaeon]